MKKEFRGRFNLPLSDEDIAELNFLKLSDDSPEFKYLRERREALGGALPARSRMSDPLTIPPIGGYAAFALNADGKQMSTAMAVVRLLSNLLRDRP